MDSSVQFIGLSDSCTDISYRRNRGRAWNLFESKVYINGWFPKIVTIIFI